MIQGASAAVFDGPGRPLRFVVFPGLEPKAGEILARVAACTLCGSDLHTYEGRRAAPLPTVLGHEILGRIEAFGPDAPRADLAGTPLAIGDRVTWAIVARCGSCFYCGRGLPQKCLNGTKYGHERLGDAPDGGLATHCRLAAGTAIVRVPDHLDDAVACPANCATATVASGVRLAGDLRDRSVLVLGAGMLGLTACAMARAAGAGAVIAADPREGRREAARRFGASHVAAPDALAEVVAAATGGFGVDVAFELSGSAPAFEGGLAALRMGGTLVLIGAVFPGPPVPLAMETIVRRQLRVQGLHNYGPDDLLAAVLFLAGHPEFPFGELVGAWMPLDRAADAFRHAADPGVFRVGVRQGAG